MAQSRPPSTSCWLALDPYVRLKCVDAEPARVSPGGKLSAKMSTLARRDTAPEMLLRRELHRRGLRFRVQFKVPSNRRRSIDIAFTRVRLAVYVDGCFWHGCPEHHSAPRTNAEWWKWKVERNRARDDDTDRLLTAAGWRVIRLWEHVPPKEAADEVEHAWRRLTDAPLGHPDLTTKAPMGLTCNATLGAQRTVLAERG